MLLRGFISPHQVAEAIAYLASDAAAMITGAALCSTAGGSRNLTAHADHYVEARRPMGRCPSTRRSPMSRSRRR